MEYNALKDRKAWHELAEFSPASAPPLSRLLSKRLMPPSPEVGYVSGP